MGICANAGFLKALKFIILLIDVIKVIVPIGMIIMGTIDLSKSMIDNDIESRKKNVMLFAKRLIYGAIIFCIPWIVNVFLILLGDLSSDINLYTCISNVDNIDYYEKLGEEASKKLDNERKTENLKEFSVIAIKDASISGSSDDDKNGSVIGQKYELSDDELTSIARLCQQEQGTATGAAAEASLMANLYEYRISANIISSSTSLYNFVKDSGWWANSAYFMKSGNLNNDVKAAVKNVLVNGYRTLPLYIDEHDCISDISYIKKDHEKLDKNNKKNYVKNKTIVHNVMGSVYTFYSFPDTNSDPFGYTAGCKTNYDSLNK